jgi:hypothetical protein
MAFVQLIVWTSRAFSRNAAIGSSDFEVNAEGTAA